MKPSCLTVQEIDEKNRRHAPCQRECPENHKDVMDEMQHPCDEDDAEKAPDGEDNTHCDDGSAKSPQNADGAVVDSQDKCKEGSNFQLGRTIIDDLWIGTKQPDEKRRPEKEDDTDNLGRDDGAGQSKLDTTHHAFRFVCTEVLADKSRQCH